MATSLSMHYYGRVGKVHSYKSNCKIGPGESTRITKIGLRAGLEPSTHCLRGSRAGTGRTLTVTAKLQVLTLKSAN